MSIKKLIATFFILLSGLSMQGQTLSVSVPVVTANVGQAVYIPVKLTGASTSGVPISGANLQVTFDTAVLKYDTITNFYSAMPQNQWFFAGNNGIVSANWLEPSLGTLAIPDNTTLYEIKFTKKSAGNSPLTFVVSEFTNAAYQVIPTTPVNGAVNAPAVFHQVTFRVDMAREAISGNGVHLAGSFNNWSYTQNAMSFTPPSSVFSVTLSLQEGTTQQYRFVNGNSAAGLESVPASCGVPNGNGQFNRQITVPTHDTVYNIVCFSMCSHCPASVNVTFRVDMQHQTPSSDGVHVSGTFNNWNYAQDLMTNAGGTIYTLSKTLDEGTYLEYKFANGITVQQAETVPAACAVNGNRFFTVPAHDTVLNASCYDSCQACGAVAQFSNVTFRVDLRAQPSISSDGVHVAGTFQGWNPASTLMNTSGDSVYSYTVSLLAGSSVQYRFVNGNTASGYETVPFLCASNDSRALLVPDHDTTLVAVCFGQCDTCILTGISEERMPTARLDQNYPNPCHNLTHIGFTLPSEGNIQLTVYNSFGETVQVLCDGPYAAGSHDLVFDCSSRSSGIYSYRMVYSTPTTTIIQNKKLVIL